MSITLPAPSGNATTDTNAILSAVAGSTRQQTVIAQDGTYQLNQLVTFLGLGLRGDGQDATSFKCTAAGAGLAFGGPAGGGRHPEVGGFSVDGNALATDPLRIGTDGSHWASGVLFKDIVSARGVNSTWRVFYYQNSTFEACNASSPSNQSPRFAWWFDGGCGGLTVVNPEIWGWSKYGIWIAMNDKTGPANSLYPCPTQIEFYGGRAEGASPTGEVGLEVDQGALLLFDHFAFLNGAAGGDCTVVNALNYGQTVPGMSGTLGGSDATFRECQFDVGAGSPRPMYVGPNAEVTLEGRTHNYTGKNIYANGTVRQNQAPQVITNNSEIAILG